MQRPSPADAEFTEFVAARSTQLYRTAYLLAGLARPGRGPGADRLTKAYAAWWRVRRADDPVAYVHGVLIKTFLSERRRRSSTRAAGRRGPGRGRSPDRTPTDRRRPARGARPRSRRPTGPWWCCGTGRTAASPRPRPHLGLSEAAVKNRSLRALRGAARRPGRRRQPVRRAEGRTTDERAPTTTSADADARSSQLMDRSMDDVHAPARPARPRPPLTRGRALRRRRRAASVALGVAAVVAVVGVALPHLRRRRRPDRRHRRRPATPQSSTPAAPTPSRPRRAPGWWDMPAAEMRGPARAACCPTASGSPSAETWQQRPRARRGGRGRCGGYRSPT